MAITTATVTKKSVSQSMEGQFSVVWELASNDGATELPVQTFSEDYKTGDPASRVISGFQEKVKAYIDKYNAEQEILASQNMTDAVTTVQSSIDAYLGG